MAVTKVNIEVFKRGSGKYYTEYAYHSDKHVIDRQGIIDEATEKYGLHEKNFTIEVSTIGDVSWNKWLILNLF